VRVTAAIPGDGQLLGQARLYASAIFAFVGCVYV